MIVLRSSFSILSKSSEDIVGTSVSGKGGSGCIGGVLGGDVLGGDVLGGGVVGGKGGSGRHTDVKGSAVEVNKDVVIVEGTFICGVPDNRVSIV